MQLPPNVSNALQAVLLLHLQKSSVKTALNDFTWLRPCCILQAEFFGLLGLADKASAELEQHSQRALGNAAGPSRSAGSVEFDSVYVETGFHPIKSEFGTLQQQQTATMQVLLHNVQGSSLTRIVLLSCC